MTMILWDTLRDDPLLFRYDHHTEFVVGLDFNLFIEGQLATCCKYNEPVFLTFLKHGMRVCLFGKWDFLQNKICCCISNKTSRLRFILHMSPAKAFNGFMKRLSVDFLQKCIREKKSFFQQKTAPEKFSVRL